MIGLVLLAFGFVFACFAAAGYPSLGRVQTFPLAFAFVVAAMLFGAALPLFR